MPVTSYREKRRTGSKSLATIAIASLPACLSESSMTSLLENGFIRFLFKLPRIGCRLCDARPPVGLVAICKKALPEFVAEFTQHIPPKGSHLIRYYGWYSNKSRGMCARRRKLLHPGFDVRWHRHVSGQLLITDSHRHGTGAYALRDQSEFYVHRPIISRSGRPQLHPPWPKTESAAWEGGHGRLLTPHPLN